MLSDKIDTDFFKGKKIFVAGETGMVGSALIRSLALLSKSVISAAHNVLDLTNQAQTYAWLKENQPDIIFMCAGKVGGIGANSINHAAFLYDNLAIAQNVIHGAYLAGVKKLVYLGSSCIYPKYAPQPITEQALLMSALEPSNEGYALAKIAGVKLCQYYKSQYGCDFVSVMPTNLYGVGDKYDTETSHVIPALIIKIYQAKENDESQVVLWGTGEPLREFLYTDDLVKALLVVAQHYKSSQPLNIGSGQEISIKDLAQKISTLIGYEGKIIFDVSKPDGTPRKILDSSRMQALGWQATTSLEQGLMATYQDFLSRQ